MRAAGQRGRGYRIFSWSDVAAPEASPARILHSTETFQRVVGVSWLQWVNHLKALQAQALRSAGEYYEVLKHRMKEDEPKTTRSFKVGDWVVMPWRSGKPDKFSVNFTGPFEVMERPSKNTYTIRDPADDKLKTVHVQTRSG